MNTSTRKIVISGVMGAISIILGATHWGFIPWFTGVALTLMHVPVIIGAVLEGPVVGLVIGLIFGAFSLLQAAIAPTGPTDVWFTNPLVSIVPRLFIGPMAWLVYRTLKQTGEELALIIAAVASGLLNVILVLVVMRMSFLVPQILNRPLVQVLIYTVAVVSALLEAWMVYQVLKSDKEPVALAIAAAAGSVTNTMLVLGVLGLYGFLPWAVSGTIAVTNGLPEAAVAAIITVAVVVAWMRIETGRKGSTV